MIEIATGQVSGSIYQDRVFPRQADGIVIKTHGLDSKDYDRAVHLVRDPIDAVRSFYHWKRDIAGEDPEWGDHFRKETLNWRNHTEHWLGATCATLLVRYENLVETPDETLTQILNWLGWSTSTSRIDEAIAETSISKLQAALPDIGERFFRTPSDRPKTPRLDPSEIAFANSELASIRARLGLSAVR